MTHAPAGRGTDTSNESDSGLVSLVVVFEEIGGVLFCGSTDFTDHDDPVCFLVLEEDAEAVDEAGPGERVPADADDEGLAESGLGGLVHGFVCESSGAGDDTDAAALVDEAGHDSDFALALPVSVSCGYIQSVLGIAERLTGAMIPGQFGPTSLVLFWVFSISVMRTISSC